MYLIFKTLEQAETANNIIAQAMGLKGDITQTWTRVLKTPEETFIILKPEDKYMINITGFEYIYRYT